MFDERQICRTTGGGLATRQLLFVVLQAGPADLLMIRGDKLFTVFGSLRFVLYSQVDLMSCRFLWLTLFFVRLG